MEDSSSSSSSSDSSDAGTAGSTTAFRACCCWANSSFSCSSLSCSSLSCSCFSFCILSCSSWACFNLSSLACSIAICFASSSSFSFSDSITTTSGFGVAVFLRPENRLLVQEHLLSVLLQTFHLFHRNLRRHLPPPFQIGRMACSRFLSGCCQA